MIFKYLEAIIIIIYHRITSIPIRIYIRGLFHCSVYLLLIENCLCVINIYISFHPQFFCYHIVAYIMNINIPKSPIHLGGTNINLSRKCIQMYVCSMYLNYIFFSFIFLSKFNYLYFIVASVAPFQKLCDFANFLR